jgi:hypothetical protein
VVIGTRGAMPAELVEALRRTGTKDSKTLLTISLIALRRSVELYHIFIDYDRAPKRWEAPRENGTSVLAEMVHPVITRTTRRMLTRSRPLYS